MINLAILRCVMNVSCDRGMHMTKSWMVRAERNGRLFDAFKEKSVVAIGWPALGDLSDAKSRKAIGEALQRSTLAPSRRARQWQPGSSIDSSMK